MDKKKIIIISFIGILTVSLVGVGIFFITKNIYEQKQNQNENKTPEKESKKELDIKDSKIQKLYNQMQENGCGGILGKTFTTQEKYEEEKISNKAKITYAVQAYLETHDYKNNISFKEDLNPYIIEMFQKSISIEDGTTIQLLNEKSSPFYRYNKTTDTFEFEEEGCGGPLLEIFLRQLESAREEDNKLYLTEKMIYIYRSIGWEEGTRYQIYNKYDALIPDSQKELTVGEKIGDATLLESGIEKKDFASTDYQLEPWLEKASSYEYIFEKIGDNYYFKEFKKVGVL